jgi:hypothetical protein
MTHHMGDARINSLANGRGAISFHEAFASAEASKIG